MSWVRVPPEAAHFSLKSECLGCAVLLCLVVHNYDLVRVPPEAAHFSLKSECLGCAVLLCLVVHNYDLLLASFSFLLHLSLTCIYKVHVHVHVDREWYIELYQVIWARQRVVYRAVPGNLG